jgi:hypothetical protein
VDGALKDKFHEAPGHGKLCVDGIPVAKSFRANHKEARPVFNLQAADCPVSLGMECVRQPQDGGQPDKRLPQGQLITS